MKIFRTICLLLVMGVAGCSKNYDTRHQLEGSWEWLRTDGGIAFQVHQTPASEGETRGLQFLPGERYMRFVNKAIVSSGTYRLETRKCIHDQQAKTYIVFSADPGMMIEKLDNTDLELSDEAFDGLGSQYRRQ